MLHTYRGKVNEDGTIRLQEEVDLPTGGEVLVVVLNEPEVEPAYEEQPAAINIRPACLCGCGKTPRGHKSKFRPGHDMRAERILERAQAGNPDPEDQPGALLLMEAARNNPELSVHGFAAERIQNILEGLYRLGQRNRGKERQIC